MLREHPYDLAVLDEPHTRMRGFSTDRRRRGKTIREHVCAAIEPVPRAWGLTGSLMCGYVRDAWGPLDALSAGAMTGRGDRTAFQWHVRYCDGHVGTHGWVSTGESELARTELPGRLAHVWLVRTRADVASQLAPKTRRVVLVEQDDLPGEGSSPRGPSAPLGGGSFARLDALRRATARMKLPAVARAVLDDLLGGLKTIAFAFNPSTAKALAKEVRRLLGDRSLGPQVRRARAAVWLATSEASVASRHEMAADFREHEGAAALVTTIGAMQVGVNLAGAVTEHWIDVHHTPAEMRQAEDRPNELGRTAGLDIAYYVVPGSVDDHLIDLVLPKLETMEGVTGDSGMGEIAGTLQGGLQGGPESPAEIAEEVLRRLAGAWEAQREA